MTFALLSRPKRPLASPKYLDKRGSAPGQRAIAPRPGFEGAAYRPHGTVPAIQTKLKIGEPNDKFEQEADRAADEVMRMPEPQLQRACACGGACPKCQTEAPDQKHQRLQAKHDGPAGLAQRAAPAIVHEVLRLAGKPLDPATRAFMEQRFGYDFSRVRVHSGPAAEQSARDVNARAYTMGHDIVFGAGRFAPGTHEGRRLIAHELTHVVQQSGADGIRVDQHNEKHGPSNNFFTRSESGRLLLANRLAHMMHQQSTLAVGQRPIRSAPPPSATGARVIQRKLECNLDPIQKECAGAAGTCMTVKDYCTTKYPKSQDLDKLHADAVKGANGYKDKFPNAADNLLHFLGGSGKEKVMNIDVFRNHPATQQKYGEHMSKFKEGASRRFASGDLKIGGPAVEIVWTDTANAFSSEYNDLGLAVGGYTLCSKVSAKAVDPKDVGGSKDYLWVRFAPWTMQAFDCYNWDPGKGIGLPFATDNDLCCLENAGRAKHFLVRTDPWPLSFPPEAVLKPPTKPP